ncbi:uncharacterized protein [Watersipora subatra]|uniref:uncharacterized protein n=1 Tax=Watersipora subatra TaxID=2589382 RepID=UPI00355AD484
MQAYRFGAALNILTAFSCYFCHSTLCPETESGRLSGAVIKIGSVTLACQHGADHDAGKKLKLKLAILHANGNHWLACTYIGSSTFARLFDSLVFDLDDQALRGIASLHKTLAPHLRLRWESVQRQDGANDCGLFAIAFLIETLFGFNTAKNFPPGDDNYEIGILSTEQPAMIGRRTS